MIKDNKEFVIVFIPPEETQKIRTRSVQKAFMNVQMDHEPVS